MAIGPGLSEARRPWDAGDDVVVSRRHGDDGVGDVQSAALGPLHQIHLASPQERIGMARSGVKAADAKRLLGEVPMGLGASFQALNLSTATMNRKAKNGETLSQDESERVIGFARLVGLLEAMVKEAGDPAGFDSKAWLARWLTDPLPALGGVRPAELMDTMEGQGLVSTALAMVQSGAYA